VVARGSVEVHQVAMVQSSTVFSISMVKAESKGNSLWHRKAEMQATATPKLTIKNYPNCSIIPIVATLTLLLGLFKPGGVQVFSPSPQPNLTMPMKKQSSCNFPPTFWEQFHCTHNFLWEILA
jgi:hypothetical protein